MKKSSSRSLRRRKSMRGGWGLGRGRGDDHSMEENAKQCGED